MKTSRGIFIVFEGMDRCGKSTQAKKLVNTLNQSSENPRAQLFQFPNRSTPIGEVIDSYLRKKIEMDDRAIHLLFTANRWEEMKNIKNALDSGIHVIVDRYSYSGAAYSASKEAMSLEWCFSKEQGLLAPDRVFYLIVPEKQQESRGEFGDERYETSQFQRKVHDNYLKLWNKKTWVEIDALGSIEEVHERVMKEFQTLKVTEDLKVID